MDTTMTDKEFDALSGLLQGPPGAAREGARRVLVEGSGTAQAARELGIHRAGIDRVLARVRKLQKGGCPTCGHPV